MNALPNPHQPANPCVLPGDKGRQVIWMGLTKREWFAAHAPAEIPGWYVGPVMTVPPVRTLLEIAKADPEFAKVSESVASSFVEWLKDGSWDPEDGYAAIGARATATRSKELAARAEALRMQHEIHYFSWRYYWADSMTQTAGPGEAPQQ